VNGSEVNECVKINLLTFPYNNETTVFALIPSKTPLLLKSWNGDFNRSSFTDFSDGQDLIGLYSGLSFGQLSFSGSNILAWQNLLEKSGNPVILTL
jgi:hypothetical protein